VFSDLALSRRLERAEGYASAQFAAARRRLWPDCPAEWLEVAGVFAVFDGADSPVTQSFGLGVVEPLSLTSLQGVERFFFDRGVAAVHEVSPHAGVAAFDLLCSRNYRPIEISNVLYRGVEKIGAEENDSLRVRVIGPEESHLFAAVSARGWGQEHPELLDFLSQIGLIATARHGGPCFIGETDGVPGAAGVLCIHDGVALFGGSATVPELRRRGLQAALLRARMRYAFEQGCDLAMMVAAPGSDSQRNAERNGFQIAYTRTKWQSSRPVQG